MVALASLLLFSAALVCGGCAGGKGDGLAGLPSLDEVRPTVSPPRGPEQGRSESGGASLRPRMELMIEQMELPLEVPLDDAWAQVDEQVLSERLREYWHANGLRAGVVVRGTEEFQAFVDALPETMGVRRHRISSRGERFVLDQGARLAEAVTIHAPSTSGVEGRRSGEYEAHGGRLRLLTRVVPSRSGGGEIELTPHHYRRRHSIKPRDPREAEFDGRVFEDLTLARSLARNQLLVIGLYHPWADGAEDFRARISGIDSGRPENGEDAEVRSWGQGGQGGQGGERSGEDETGGDGGIRFEISGEDEAMTPTQLRSVWREQYGEPPELPEHFGRLVLTGLPADRPTQTLIILSARPLEVRRAVRDAD